MDEINNSHEEIKNLEQLIGKLWFQNKNTMLLKFPNGFADLKLPIKLERSLAIVLKKDCIELRNLIVKQ